MVQPPLETPWYLVGLPGSGKSKVGRILSRLFCVPHVDVDAQIEAEAGRSISEIFQESGEDVFRALEREAILSSGKGPAIISLGGGAVGDPEVRRYLEDQTVIWLDASDKELVRRVKRKSHRPLLRDDPAWTIARLRRERKSLYEEVATAQVTSTSAPAFVAADQVLQDLLGWETIPVCAQTNYCVRVGWGTTALLAGALPRESEQVFLVLPETLLDLAGPVVAELERAGKHVVTFAHPEGESSKDLSVVERVWDLMGKEHIGRKDTVVTFGGGATTDLGGFLAATWTRGIQVVHLPTSLLAMVDASVGSKTGINTAAGKNLVGAFHDPRAVLVDLNYLATLPSEEYVAGLAEVIKAGFIGDEEILALVKKNSRLGERDWGVGEGSNVLAELVVRSIRLKARVVGEDRLEGGMREHLNYGHTLGHAIERHEQFKVRHGEAVAIGAVFAAHLAHLLGLTDEETVARHEELFSSVGLPTRHRGDIGPLLLTMRSDKKTRGRDLRFALLHPTGMAVTKVTEQDIRRVARSLETGGDNS